MLMRLAVFGCLMLPSLATAQNNDAVIKNFAPADFEKFITNELKTTFTNNEGEYDIHNTAYYAVVRDKFLLLYARLPKSRLGGPVTLEKTDAWNRGAIFSRVYLEGDVFIRYEGTVTLAGGISQNQLKNFYLLFDAEYRGFLQHFGGLKNAPGEAIPAALGPPEVVRQGFPAMDFDENNLSKSDTAWEIEWDFAPVPYGKNKQRPVFRIASAKFHWKDARGRSRSIVVARNLQLVEAFSQYDDANRDASRGTCWLDIAMVQAHSPIRGKDEFLGPACIGPGSSVLKSKNKAWDGLVNKELHYDGLRWMSSPSAKYGGLRARKGEKLLLWSAFAAENYVYIMEYVFMDDGRIGCRLGFTAHNYFDRAKVKGGSGRFRQKDHDVHLHIGCWRFDFDLTDGAFPGSGPKRNDLKLVRRAFDDNSRTFQQEALPFPGDPQAVKENSAREGKARWIAKEFTTLRAESLEVKNASGKSTAYDLISTRNGTAANLQPVHNASGLNMDFVNYDFWITRTPQKGGNYHLLSTLAKNEQPLAGQASTVWHSVPGLHVPRDEDFGVGGVDATRGLALTEWIGFTLRPRNLFDSSPLYPSR